MANQLNITAGSDVMLNVTLEHEGTVMPPLLIDELKAYLISGLGKQTELDATAQADYIVVNVPWETGRVPGVYSLLLTGSVNGVQWAARAAILRYTTNTEPGASEVTVEGDTYDVTMEVGYHYTDTPINAVEVTVDGGVGTPSADVDYHDKELDFVFHDIKGEQGDRGNGIASIETAESTEPGGINTVTFITDDDPEGTSFHVQNGIVGPQGDSVIVGEGDLPLAHVLGDSTEKAMSQKGVTDGINNTINKILYNREYVQSDLIAGHFYKANNIGTATEYGSQALASCLLLECKQGDKFSLITYARSTTCPYLFLDGNMVILAKAASGAFDGKITAPTNVKYIAVNLYGNNEGHNFYLKAESVYDVIGVLKQKESELVSKVSGEEYLQSDLVVGHFYEANAVGSATRYGNQALASCLLLECGKGDVFHLKTYARKTACPYLFLDENMIILEKAASGAFDGKITAPTNVKYIAVNLYGNNEGHEFYLKKAGELEELNDKVNALGCIVEWTLPATIYAIRGLEKSIYFDNIVNKNDDAPNYCLQVSSQFGNADARRFFFTENSAAAKSLTIAAVDSNNQTIDSRTVSFQVLPNTLSEEKRICCIGDSITEKHNMPYYVEECLKRVLTQGSVYPTFVGTKGGVNGGYDGLPTKHEGHYGRSYQWLASNSSSPFINPSTNTLDIAYYKTVRLGMESDEHIDVVSLAMGYNGTSTNSDANSALSAMQSIIAAFKADNADTKFIVHLPTYPGMGNYDNTNEFGRVKKKNSILYFRNLCLNAYNDNQDPNIVIGDMGLGYDRWYAYPRESRRPASYYDNDRIDIITDYTHPSADGTKQMGENITAVILKMLQAE